MPMLPATPVASLSTASVRSGTRSNLADIDVMRGIAALVVAAMHTREITWVGMRVFWQQHGADLAPDVAVGYATFPLVWGAIGVPIFFVLSGYCIHRTQAFARAHGGAFQLSSANFLVRRFFRIYPVLFGALLLTLLCDSLSRRYVPNSYKLGDTGTISFLVNLFSLQGVAGRTYGSNLPLWTLAIEVQFYVLYPLLLVLISRLGSVTSLGILVIGNIVSYFVAQRHGYELFSSYYVSWYLGVLVAESEAAGLLSARLSSPGFRAALYGCSVVLLSVGCATMFVSPYLAFQVWAVAFSVFLFVVLKRSQGWRALPLRVFQWFGTFSFSIYIIHLPVIVLIHSIFFNSVHQSGIAPFFGTLVAVVGCAYVFSLVFERPALALSQKFKGRRLVKSPAQQA